MCGPQLRFDLFTFRPIASKQLNSLTTIVTLSELCGAEETHPLSVREVPGSIPGSAKVFMFDFLFWLFVTKYCNFFCNITIFSVLS